MYSRSCWSVGGADTRNVYNILVELVISWWRGHTKCVKYTGRVADQLVARTHGVSIMYSRSCWSVGGSDTRIVYNILTELMIISFPVSANTTVYLLHICGLPHGFLTQSWLLSLTYLALLCQSSQILSLTIPYVAVALCYIYTFLLVCSHTAVVFAWMWVCLVCWIVSCPKLYLHINPCDILETDAL